MATALKGIITWAGNRQDYFHYWAGSTLYTDWDTAVLRNLLTTIFIVLGHGIIWTGAYYLKIHNLRRILSGERVPVSHLTSWLSLPGAASYIWHTCRFPGGYYGLLMLITGAFSLAHQYFVNSFIQASQIQTTCAFDSGVAAVDDSGHFLPSSTLSAATTILNAQYNSYYNNGVKGIYRLVPSNSFYFSPTENDLLGQWTCTSNGNTSITSADWNNNDALNAFLLANNLLNPNTGYYAGSIIAGGSWNGFLSWYSDQPNSIIASMVYGLDGASGSISDWSCVLQLLNGWTPPVIDSQKSLTEWAQKTYGFLQDLPSAYYGSGVELMLNAMFMAAAGGNSDQRTAAFVMSKSSSGVDLSFGCVLPGTKIMVGIWVILGAFLLIFIPLSLGCLFSLFQKSHKRKDIDLPTNEPGWGIALAPTSVFDWQTVFVQVMIGHTIKVRNLRKYLAESGKNGTLVVGTVAELEESRREGLLGSEKQ